MFNRVGRAFYSTGVTQEFLQNILARAQEATAKRKSNEISRPAKRRREHAKKGNHHSIPVTPRVKPTASPNVVKKRPQFKKSGSSRKATSAGADLIDVMSGSATQSHPKKKPGLKKPKREISTREIPAISKVTVVKGGGERFLPRPVVQKEYIPQEPTPLSLVKFQPDVATTSASRMINYSLDALRSSNYPLNRLPNYGFYDRVQGRAKHIVISLQNLNFGKYQPDQGLMFQREKLLSELTIECEPSKRDVKVNGKYRLLKHHPKESFEGIAKSEKKKEELFINGQVVRKSLEKNPMNPDVKELVYDVCSGLKPVSDLWQ